MINTQVMGLCDFCHHHVKRHRRNYKSRFIGRAQSVAIYQTIYHTHSVAHFHFCHSPVIPPLYKILDEQTFNCGKRIR